MESKKLTEEEIDLIYGFLNLEWEDMPESIKQDWITLLTEIENKQNEGN